MNPDPVPQVGVHAADMDHVAAATVDLQGGVSQISAIDEGA